MRKEPVAPRLLRRFQACIGCVAAYATRDVSIVCMRAVYNLDAYTYDAIASSSSMASTSSNTTTSNTNTGTTVASVVVATLQLKVYLEALDCKVYLLEKPWLCLSAALSLRRLSLSLLARVSLSRPAARALSSSASFSRTTLFSALTNCSFSLMCVSTYVCAASVVISSSGSVDSSSKQG
jgi:hypothetical protein